MLDRDLAELYEVALAPEGEGNEGLSSGVILFASRWRQFRRWSMATNEECYIGLANDCKRGGNINEPHASHRRRTEWRRKGHVRKEILAVLRGL